MPAHEALSTLKRMERLRPHLVSLATGPLFAGVLVLYTLTLAPGVLFGDPTEYQFIPYILGIAHPPGYAFYTLLAALWQRLVSVGTVAYRTNLLAATAGAVTVLLVYGMVAMLLSSSRSAQGRSTTPQVSPSGPLLAALFAALSLAASADFWQHSLHANAHIVSAALAALTLWTGLRWWRTARPRWLYAFAFLAALGVTHHPLLAFGGPAYLLFTLILRPRLLREPRSLLKIGAALALGLVPFLYFPLRSPTAPFGPTDMRTWAGFVRHATAQGLRVNLFHFGLADQPDRLRVFWELLRLQYPLPTLALAGAGLLWLLRRRPKPASLLLPFFLTHLAFTINTVQDVMAYLLIPFTVVAVLAGLGAGWLAALLRQWGRPREWLGSGLALLLLVLPMMTALHNGPRLSLRNYRAAETYTQEVFDRFAGRGEGAVLLADWEHLTPLWYAQYVEGRRLDPQDVELVFVAAGSANPWVENVWARVVHEQCIPRFERPLYLSGYRREVAQAEVRPQPPNRCPERIYGLRLRPVGPTLYRVLLSSDRTLPPLAQRLDLVADDVIRLLGYELDRERVPVGETVYLTLAMRTDRRLKDYYLPFVLLGDRAYRWTTDSRLNTPWWEPGEVVVERFEITIPFGVPPGRYPLRLGMHNLSRGEDVVLTEREGEDSGGEMMIELGTLEVAPARGVTPSREVLARALGNFDSKIALVGARVRAGGQRREAPWREPLRLRAGQTLHVTLGWRALQPVLESYTVFVHLIGPDGQVWAQQDYTPMGGAFPTFLWIPKWIEGQQVADPSYRLRVPDEAPAGDYYLEVGLYGMTTVRRLPLFDRQGNLAGDRVVLGPVQVVRGEP